MKKTNAVHWLGLAAMLALAASGWAQENQQRGQRRGGGQGGQWQGGFGNFVSGSVLSSEADGSKLSVLTTSSRGGTTEGIHPAALDEAAKQLRAKADASTVVAEAITLRAAAKQLDNLRGQTQQLGVAPDAIVQTVKLLTVKDIAVDSRIQFSGEFEEGLPEGEIPTTITLARGFGNAPPMIWSAPSEAQNGMRRWGQINRGTFVGKVTAVSPLTVDLGTGKAIAVTIPAGVEVRFLQTKGAGLENLKAGMNVVAFTNNNDGGPRVISRLYAGEVDLDQLGLGFLGGFGGGRGGGDRGGQRGQ